MALVLCVVLSGCAGKNTEAPDNTRGGVMGDVYLTVTSADTEVSGVKVQALQSDVTLTQSKYADVYEVGGKLSYQHGFTAFSQDEVLRNGFYLTFDVCAANKLDTSKAVITVKSGGTGAARTFSGADFKDGKLTVTERLISENGETYENIRVTFDLDGTGDKYFAETYTLDLSGIEATLRAFMFGEWPMCSNYQYITFEDFAEKGQKLVMQLDAVGLKTVSTAAVVDLYELFQNPTKENDFEYSTYAVAKTTKPLLDSNAYDMIFLQSGRYHTLRNKEQHDGNLAAAVKLCKFASEQNPNVIATVFAPYGIQYRTSALFTDTAYMGKATNHAEHVVLINKEADQMVQAIDASGYLKNAANVVYVGNAFENYSADALVIQADLFGVNDGITGVATNRNKASVAGAYLMAATLYADTFNASPIGVGVFGNTMYNFDTSLKGEDTYLLALLDKYSLTPDALALKLQKVAHSTVFGKDGADYTTATVTFESNGGSVVSAITAKVGEKLSAPAAPTRDGYTFMGWYRDSKLIQPAEFIYETVPYGGTTFYAAWEKAGDTSYIVEHYVEGTDGSYTLYKTDLDRVAQADSVVSGTLFGVPGYVYNPAHPDGRASAVVSADFNAKIKLYYDRAEYIVSYEYAEEYTNVPPTPDEFVVKYGDTVNVAAAPTMNGYTFIGWTSRDTLVKDGKFTVPAKDVVLSGYLVKSESLPEIKLSTVQTIYGKDVLELHDGITVKDNVVTGTLKYTPDFTGYAQEIGDDSMVLVKYADSKYAYGNYLVLNITFPADAGNTANIEFIEGTDNRTFEAADKKSFDVALRVGENAEDIIYVYDDGKGNAVTSAIDLDGVKLNRVNGFETLMAAVKAYKDRGDDLQYETYAMSKSSTGSGHGMYRHDNKGIAEIGTWQHMTFHDCSRWMQAVFYTSLNYDFENTDGTSTMLASSKHLLYYYEVTGKETASQKKRILEEYRSVLQPGDCIIYKYQDNISGHIMLYIGDETIVHCAGQSFREGNGLNTITGKAYDMDDIGGSIFIDPLSICFDQGSSRGLFSNPSPKCRFGIFRPYQSEVVEETPYGILHKTFPDLYIEKTTSHPHGYTLAVGDEVTFTTLYENRGAKDIVIDLEEMIPEGATLVSGNQTQTLRLNGFDSKTIRVTYRLEQSAIDWMDEQGFTRITFNHKVNGAEMNPLDVQITKALTTEQIEKIHSFDLSTLTSTNDFDLMIEFYQKVFGYDLTQRLEGCKDFEGIMKKLVDAHATSDYLTINYDLSGATGDLLSTTVDGLYGGVRVRSTNLDNHALRIKKLTSYNLMPGDIILYSGKSNCKVTEFTQEAGMFIYLGDNTYISANADGLITTFGDGYTRSFLKDDLQKIFVTDMVAQLNGKGVFITLRPAQNME